MACSPALTCWTAWLPVSAPSAATASSSASSLRRRSAPRRASVYSSRMEPRRRTTSSAEYVRAVSFQRGLVSHSFCSLAACWPIVSTVVPSSDIRLSGPISACFPGSGTARLVVCKVCYFFTDRKVILSFAMKDSQNLVQTDGIDLVTFGQRLRHLRRMRGLTLTELGERIDRAPSVLSLIENGRREPKLSLIEQLAGALSVPTTELLNRQPPSRRAQLEIALADAQQDPSYRRLGLPPLKIGARVPTDVLEHLVAVAAELRAQQSKPAATPEEARAANAALRAAMRERGNYFEVIEREAAGALRAGDYAGGPLSQGMLVSVVSRHGFAIRYVQDLPRSVRSLTDLRNRRIYVKQEAVGGHSPRAIVLQALGHFLLGHQVPRDFADFLRQRVEANYFAAAVLMPETAAAPVLDRAKQDRDLAVEVFVYKQKTAYEMAAHRFTNLATHHLNLPCHFVKNDASGVIYKAYENDGVVFPADPSGAIEGQRLCREWSGRQVFGAADRFSPYFQNSDTPSGTYFCVAQVDPRGPRF